MKTKKTPLLLALLSFPVVSLAQSVPAPALNAGDTWTYANTVETAPNGWRQTHDEVSVSRTTSDHIYFEVKPTGSSQSPKEMIAGADWSRERNVNGTETVVNRPLSFPLSTGKTWDLEVTEAHPNPKYDSETSDLKFKVVDTETIEVPAGKFQAIKIEAEGQWTAQVAPGQTVTQGMTNNPGDTTLVTQTHRTTPQQVSGQLYEAFWYVPEVGRWVKSVEEYYGSNGVRSQRISAELESFKRATP
ncbi:MAG: hypothetical protein WDN30_10015 [Pararobbsia sp.]